MLFIGKASIFRRLACSHVRIPLYRSTGISIYGYFGRQRELRGQLDPSRRSVLAGNSNLKVARNRYDCHCRCCCTWLKFLLRVQRATTRLTLKRSRAYCRFFLSSIAATISHRRAIYPAVSLSPFYDSTAFPLLPFPRTSPYFRLTLLIFRSIENHTSRHRIRPSLEFEVAIIKLFL